MPVLTLGYRHCDRKRPSYTQTALTGRLFYLLQAISRRALRLPAEPANLGLACGELPHYRVGVCCEPERLGANPDKPSVQIRCIRSR